MRRVRNSLLDVNRGDLDRIREHDCAAMLLLCGPGDAVVIVATERVQLELVKADLTAGRFFQNHCSSSITHC